MMGLKVAIVGCGKIADGHVEELQKLSGMLELVAVCDLEPLMAEQLAARYGIARHYADFDKLLEVERPDVVHVTTPPMVHKPLALRALEAGCHVFVEKPLTMNHQDSKALIDAVQRAQRKLCLGYTAYYEPPAMVMRSLIEQGVLGEPIHLESFYGYSLTGPFGKALMAAPGHWVHRLPGRLLQNTIDHMFNKITEFVDDDHPQIIATGYRLRPQRFGDERDKLHDELRLIVRGERVSAYGTFSSHVQPLHHYCRLFGTKNTMHIDYVSRTVTLQAQPSLPSAIGRLLPAFEQAVSFAREGAHNVLRFAKSEFHYFAGLQELFRRFYGSIIDDDPLPISYRDMLRIARMMDDTWAQLATEDERTAQAATSGDAAADEAAS